MTRSSARPFGITALIIFFLVGTLISFVAGLSLLIPSAFFNGMWQLNPHRLEGLLRIGYWAVVLLFSAAASCAITAVGLWRRARWGLVLAIVLIGINLFSDLVNTILGTERRAIVGVPIALLIILYLLTKRGKQYFSDPNHSMRTLTSGTVFPSCDVSGRGLSRLLLLINVFNSSAQKLRNAPCLCNATTRCMRGIAIEDFRDLAKASFA